MADTTDQYHVQKRASATIMAQRSSGCSTPAAKRRGDAAGAEAVLKKGPWSPWEDQLLVEYVSKHGEGNWKEVAQRSGLFRCGKSCRLRWTNQLRPHLRKDRFTPTEEATILLLHSIHGNKWAKISAQLPGRTDNSIKNFMNTRAKRQKRQLASATPTGAISASSVPASCTLTSMSALAVSTQAASSSSSVISSRAHPTSLSYHSLMQTNNRTWPVYWPLQDHWGRSTPACVANFQQRALRKINSEAAPSTSSSTENTHDNMKMQLPRCNNLQLSGAIATHHDQYSHAFSVIDDQLGRYHNPLASGLDPMHCGGNKAVETNYSCGLLINSSKSQLRQLGHVDAEPQYGKATGVITHSHPAYVGQLQHQLIQSRLDAEQLPSVQISSPTSCCAGAFTDPLALLGGNSVRLFNDSENLCASLSFSPDRPNISAGTDPQPSNCTSTVESATADSSHADYTLECIIKPLQRNLRY